MIGAPWIKVRSNVRFSPYSECDADISELVRRVDSCQARLGFEPSLETRRAEERGSVAGALYQQRVPAPGLLACALLAVATDLNLSTGVSWGADPRLAAPTRQRARRRGSHAAGAPRSSRRMRLALSTLSGVRPMIALTPLARAAELYARMDAERRSLRTARLQRSVTGGCVCTTRRSRSPRAWRSASARH
jgi:hypothetical protein